MTEWEKKIIDELIIHYGMEYEDAIWLLDSLIKREIKGYDKWIKVEIRTNDTGMPIIYVERNRRKEALKERGIE